MMDRPTTGIAADLPRRLGWVGAAALMVGVTVGSGIFRTPSVIAQEMGNPWLILGLWAGGGLLALFGALTWAELSTMFPRSGGVYVYLYEGFGPAVAFVFGWTYMLITKPFAAAGIAVVAVEHVNLLLPVALHVPATVCAVLTGFTLLSVAGTRLGAGVAVVFTVLKLAALALIVGLACALGAGDSANFAAGPAPRVWYLALAPAMAAILWTYDGWSDLGAIAGEVRRPQYTLPRLFLLVTALLTVLYVSVNAVYLWVIPLEKMREVDSVAPLIMERLLGTGGAVVVTVMIVISTLGATQASILTGARITFGQARDGLLFGFLARIHPSRQTPDVSLWTQLALSCVAVLGLQSFQKLADGFVFTMWIFYALGAAAVIVLRVRRPDLPRPYRCWGYPVVPVLFVLAAIGVTVLSILDSPSATLPWLGVLAAGWPMYLVWKACVRRAGAA